jgi:headcase protein
MTDADRSQPLNVPRGSRSSRYRTHSSGSLSSSFGSPSGLTNLNSNNAGSTSIYLKKSTTGANAANNVNSMSSSSSMGTGNNAGTLPPFDEKHAAAGNIFEHRQDWSILNRLPLHKRNAIHIRLEDEGPYGNDETRCFVLSQLSMVGCTDVTCTVCGQSMIVYDRYPLVDGTLFLR